MLVAVFVGYQVQGLAGGLVAGAAMFLPVSLLMVAAARHWRSLAGLPWAIAAQRTLAPIGLGLTAAGLLTLGRSAVHDPATAVVALAATPLFFWGRLPPIAIVLGAGLCAALVRRSG
jgi:chromate transporter